MATPRERAFGLLQALRADHRRPSLVARSSAPEDEGRVAGTVGALLAVGLISERELREALDDARPAYGLAADAGERAAELLERLVEAVVEQGDEEGMAAYRFDGALDALAAVGAADREVWDRRLRERTGRMSAEEEWKHVRRLNAGGTEQQLVAVVPGSDRMVDGAMVLYALRFVDGISFTLWRVPQIAGNPATGPRAPVWEWELRDDQGTEYQGGGFSGSEVEQHMQWRTPPPAQAAWAELVGPSGDAIRLAL